MPLTLWPAAARVAFIDAGAEEWAMDQRGFGRQKFVAPCVKRDSRFSRSFRGPTGQSARCLPLQVRGATGNRTPI